jgi:hypothetical protein
MQKIASSIQQNSDNAQPTDKIAGQAAIDTQNTPAAAQQTQCARPRHHRNARGANRLRRPANAYRRVARMRSSVAWVRAADARSMLS